MREFRILEGDVLERLAELPADLFDACLCDPPYGLAFMGKAWDHGVPAASTWAALLRVLKPGATLLAFGGTRTHHRLMVAIEDAGFEIRDCMMWLYGSGFPKSLDISKAIDKAAGAERVPVGVYRHPDGKPRDWASHNHEAIGYEGGYSGSARAVTLPGSSESARWHGYGTALKPAWEPIIVAMKPCAGTFAENALRHGVAGINVDAGRIGTGQDKASGGCAGVSALHGGGIKTRATVDFNIGRWPANVIFDDEAAAMLDEASGELHGAGYAQPPQERWSYDLDKQNTYGSGVIKASGARVGDSGGASRFFYIAKADSGEREIGGIRNTHPTVKPIDLAAYLAKLILPPERDTPRRIIVPFSGSGSEIIGALRAGWDEAVGIEITPEYIEIARRRIAADAPMFNVEVA